MRANPTRRHIFNMLESFCLGRKLRKKLAAVLLVVALPGTIHAANLYWDTNGVTAGAGGATPSGTWDTTTTNWTIDSTGASAGTTWTDGNTATFSAGTDATGIYT